MLRNLLLICGLAVCSNNLLLASMPEPAPWITIFAHGLGGDAAQCAPYQDYVGPMIAQDGPEWSRAVYGAKVGPKMSCLAQDGDVAVIHKQVAMHIGKKIALVGVSKGAATLVNAAVAAADFLLLESPFATPEKVAKNVVKETGRRHKAGGGFWSSLFGGSLESSADLPSFEPIVRVAAECAFPQYNRAGITPLKAMTERWPLVANKEMVIVLLHSREDALISVNDSRLLYVKYRKLGFKNTYLIEMPCGMHANVLWDPRNQQQLAVLLPYIYRRHGLPFAIASRGSRARKPAVMSEAEILAAIQPSIEEVEARMPKAADSCYSSAK